MSKAEIKFRKWLANEYPTGYIRKIPDFKQTASSLMRGMPDYLVINKGFTYWYEVKFSSSQHTFNRNLFTDAQMVEFKKMLQEGGVDVLVAVYNRDFTLFIMPFSRFLESDSVYL